MRLFGGDRMDRISGLMQRTEIDDDMPIQAKMVTKGIESAQRQVEAMHFSSRKHVLEYDDVMDKQRKTIYAERNDILDGKSYAERVPELIVGAVEDAVLEYCPGHDVYEDWDIEGLNAWFKELTGIEFDLDELDHREETSRMVDVVSEKVLDIYEHKKDQIPEDVFDQVQNQVMLRVIDTRWMSHLSEMDYLRAGIGLRAVGQRDPLVEYKEEAYSAFSALVAAIYEDFIRTVLRLQVTVNLEQPEQLEDQETLNSVSYSAPDENIPDATSKVAGNVAPATQTTASGSMGNARPAPRTDVTTLVRAAAARSTRSATAQLDRIAGHGGQSRTGACGSARAHREDGLVSAYRRQAWPAARARGAIGTGGVLG